MRRADTSTAEWSFTHRQVALGKDGQVAALDQADPFQEDFPTFERPYKCSRQLTSGGNLEKGYLLVKSKQLEELIAKSLGAKSNNIGGLHLTPFSEKLLGKAKKEMFIDWVEAKDTSEEKIEKDSIME